MRLLSTLAEEIWRSRHTSALLLLSTLGCLAPSLAAQSPRQPSTTPSQSSAVASESTSHYLHITINPSTANIIEGAVYGLDAELENVSNMPITIDLDQVQLAVQPELAPPDVSCTWFYDAGANDKVPSPMVMQPGDHFTVFFDMGSAALPAALKDNAACRATYWGRLRRQLDFVPGNFNFVLTGIFSTPAVTGSALGLSPTTPGVSSQTSTKLDEHYFTETANLPVTIDQSQIIIYAGLGGLLAFLVTSFRSASTLSDYAGSVQAVSSKPHPKFLIILRQAAAAVLVSVTVTVIASRLSTTSFPVRVSVEDFWGALTVGFVSYFIGGKFIEKLSDTLAPKSGSGATASTSTPAHAVVDSASGPDASALSTKEN